MKRTSYTVKESDGFVDVTILVDTPNCHAITVIVHSKEQTPVDASGKNKIMFCKVRQLLSYL